MTLPPANVDILLKFDNIWRIGRYLTEKEHFLQYGEYAPNEPRFYCHSDGLERYLLSVQDWKFIKSI